MENKEITILDLVKIALNWIWVLLIGAGICAAVAFFYSTKMVTPMYSSSSKYVIQTKGQDASSDVLESQRTVAYAQLVVGTYVDILNTRDFAVEVANYLNGNYSERTYSPEGVKNVVNASIRQAIFEDGGLVEGGQLDAVIDSLCDAGFIDESNKALPVADVAKSFIENADTLTDTQFTQEVVKALKNGKLIPDYVHLEDEMYVGVSNEEAKFIETIRKELGKEYNYKMVKGMLSFGSAEDSTTFTVTVRSANPEEAYAVARLCEVIIPGYIEARYPGSGLARPIDSAVFNENPINNNTTLLTLVGFIAGFVLAFIVVYIIELADNRVKNQEELAEKTGLSVMGIIPDTQNEKNNSGAYVYGKNYK